jgi:hypothetical protein
MATFSMMERVENEETEPREFSVEDFAEATWLLTQDLHDTCSKEFGVEILRDWMNLDQDSGKVQEVVKTEKINDSICYTFRYDPFPAVSV